jgi:hypothetical protein
LPSWTPPRSAQLRVLHILNGMGEKQGQAEDEWIRMIALFEDICEPVL